MKNLSRQSGCQFSIIYVTSMSLHSDVFPKCEHDMLEPRMWIKKGSKAYVELSSIVESKYLMRDIEKLSYQKQTSSIEGFHRVVILFAPKHTHFFYRLMEARLFIAALHFNENGNEPQKTKNGGQTEEALIWRVAYSKSKDGQGVIKPVKVDSTYG
ncbi:uncharacterized protein LOC124447623 [Xenia sp. Carnegie-2017]|uniref:uncharacterized protein LOC124447623 n=1 Tax=Xenia sp. Carnegie-2017 TaxID=2897299 RepID=UPI001F035630|nr:uncharacterized protein LOC124447623 [Xenia sp. Carnegie-2017]